MIPTLSVGWDPLGSVVLTVLCGLCYFPDPHAVVQDSETIAVTRIGGVALCGAPLGLGFVLAVIVALAEE